MVAKKAKAKGRKPAARKKAADRPAQSETAMKMPSVSKLKELIALMNRTKETNGELNGRLGATLRAAAETGHVHIRALKRAFQFLRMEAGILHDDLAHFRFYCDVLGVDAKAESAPRLPLDQASDDGEPITDDDTTNGTGEPAEAAPAEEGEVHQTIQ